MEPVLARRGARYGEVDRRRRGGEAVTGRAKLTVSHRKPDMPDKPDQSAITDQLPVMTDEGTQMLFVVMRREERNWDGWTDGNLWTVLVSFWSVSVSVGAAHDDSTSLVSMDVYDIPSPPIATGPMPPRCIRASDSYYQEWECIVVQYSM